MAALTIARLTIREAARRRLLVALALLTLAVIGLTGWGFHHIAGITAGGVPLTTAEVQLAASQLLVLVEFMFSGVLALSAVIIAAPSISGEVESGISLAMLARPLSRFQVVLGKWLGFAALVTVYTVVSGAIELLVVAWTTGYAPPGPVGVIAYLVAEGIVLMSLALLLSTRLAGMTGGVIGLVLFFLAWMGGVAGTVGQVFNNSGISNAATVSRLLLPTDGLWRGSIYELEPAFYRAVFGATRERAGNPFFVESGPSIAYLIWCAAWVAAMVGLAVWSFRRREI